MFSVLFEIPIAGGYKIHTYGVMVAIGFLAALAWIRHWARREQVSVAAVARVGFLVMVAAIVGSRLAFVVVEWRYYVAEPLAVFRLWEGGLVFYGGLLACIPTAWFYLKRHRLNFWKVADIFMPGVALGHAFGRLGCF